MFVIGMIVGTFLIGPALERQRSGTARSAPVTVAAQTTPAKAFEEAEARGNAAMDAGRCEEAIAAYESALALRFVADVATDRGVCLRELGRREQALAAFEFVVLKDPSHWKARYNLTAMLLEARRLAEAEASFAVLKRLAPTDDDAMRTLERAFASAR